jgi:hypothetical protein
MDTTLLSGKNPDACGIGGWLGPRAGPDIVERRITSYLYRESIPMTVQPIAYSLYQLQYFGSLVGITAGFYFASKPHLMKPESWPPLTQKSKIVWYLVKQSSSNMCPSMAPTVCLRPVISEAWVWFQVSPCRTFSGGSDTGTAFSHGELR